MMCMIYRYSVLVRPLLMMENEYSAPPPPSNHQLIVLLHSDTTGANV